MAYIIQEEELKGAVVLLYANKQVCSIGPTYNV